MPEVCKTPQDFCGKLYTIAKMSNKKTTHTGSFYKYNFLYSRGLIPSIFLKTLLI